MRRELAAGAHEAAVPVDLVSVVDAGEIEGEIGGSAGDGGNVNVAAVPGEAGVAGVGLVTPGLVDAELFPGGVVEDGGGEGGVVAEVELPEPWTVRMSGGAGVGCVCAASDLTAQMEKSPRSVIRSGRPPTCFDMVRTSYRPGAV
jgi:hypothetical protein